MHSPAVVIENVRCFFRSCTCTEAGDLPVLPEESFNGS
jgi:hypothetical protein